MRSGIIKGFTRLTAIALVLMLCASLLPAFALAEAAETDPALEQGYTETLKNYSTEVRWVERGGEKIFGKFYYPLDFDPAKQYPVIVMCHGVNATHALFEKGKWVDFTAANGCVAYAFDFCGSSQRALSSMAMEDMTIDTQMADLNAVLDMVLAQDFVDPDYLFLMGQSFGGFISAITAPDRDNDVRGLMLLYPAICAVDMVHDMFPKVKDIPNEGGSLFNVPHPKAYFKAIWNLHLEDTMRRYNGKVLIIHGENDPTVPISYSQKAVDEIYRPGQAELLTVTGKKSVHAFEVFYEEGREAAQTKTAEFLNAQIRPYHRIVCVGDSITYGILRDGKGEITQLDNYPLKLNELLGDAWKVCNYGQPGAYATKDDGKLSYWNLRQFVDSRKQNAEAVIVMLGSNDSPHWNEAAYRESLSALLDAYRESVPEAKLFLMIPPSTFPNPVTGEMNNSINADVIDHELPAIVAEIAAEKGAVLIDLHTLTADHPEWYADGLHLDGDGYQAFADYIFEVLEKELFPAENQLDNAA